MYKYIIISIRPAESHYCSRSCNCYEGGCSFKEDISFATSPEEAAEKIATFEANCRTGGAFDGTCYHNVFTMANFVGYENYESEFYSEDSNRSFNGLEYNSIPDEILEILDRYREEVYLKQEEQAKEAKKRIEEKERAAAKERQATEDLRKFEELKKKLGK